MLTHGGAHPRSPMPMWFLQPSHQMLYGISNLNKDKDFLLLFFKSFSLHLFTDLAVCGGQKMTLMGCSFLLPCGLGTELRCSAWQQEPLPTEPLLSPPHFLKMYSGCVT